MDGLQRIAAIAYKVSRSGSTACVIVAQWAGAAYHSAVPGTPDPMIVLRPAAEGLPCAMWLRPNRALSRKGLRRLIVVLAALALTTAGLGAWQGNVFAPLFALVESVAMAIALSVAWRAGDRGERITLDESSLEVRSLPGQRRIQFQSHWVRVMLTPGQGRQRLVLASHGRELEIGAFLGEEERAELSKKLMVLLAELKSPWRR